MEALKKNGLASTEGEEGEEGGRGAGGEVEPDLCAQLVSNTAGGVSALQHCSREAGGRSGGGNRADTNKRTMSDRLCASKYVWSKRGAWKGQERSGER